MSVPPVPVPGGDQDHLFEKIRLQHSWYLSCCFLWNPREQPPITVGEAVTICEGQIALCRSSSLLPSPGSSVLCFAGLLLSASSPPCGRGNSLSFPLTLQQPGMQSRARGLLLSRGVLALSVVTFSAGRQRPSVLAHRFPVCCIGKGMAPRRGSGKRLRCGQQDAAPWGAGGQEERSWGRGSGFHSRAQIILSKAGRGCPWERTGNRARFPCVRPLGLFLFTPVLICLLNLPSCQIFTSAFAAGGPCRLHWDQNVLLNGLAEFSGWEKKLVVLLFFLLLWQIKTGLKQKSFYYNRSFKNNYYFPQVRQYRKSDRFNVLRWWGYFFFLLLMDHSGCVTFF